VRTRRLISPLASGSSMPSKSTTVPRASGDAGILRAAYVASERTQLDFARDVLGMSLSGFTGWLAGEPCPPAIVRLCWAITEHPELADEIADRFG